MPYHKRRRKSVRFHLDQRKTARKRKTLEPSLTLQTIELLSLPNSWKLVSGTAAIQLCKFQAESADNLLALEKSISIMTDLLWKVFSSGIQLPAISRLLHGIPSTLKSSSDVLNLLRRVENAIICPGNRETLYVSLVEKRGGSIRSERGSGDSVGYVDCNSMVHVNGQSHSMTVRRRDCDLLCMRGVNSNQNRCKKCQAFRLTLRSALSRLNKTSESIHTDSSSHTKYASLNSTEKDARLRSMHSSLHSLKQQKNA